MSGGGRKNVGLTSIQVEKPDRIKRENCEELAMMVYMESRGLEMDDYLGRRRRLLVTTRLYRKPSGISLLKDSTSPLSSW